MVLTFKYSDVFEAYNIVRREKCVIKFLKPVKVETKQPTDFEGRSDKERD
jgi:hypothetical protein